MAPEFSERGDAPTDYERALVAKCGDDEPRHVRQLWLLIAKRVGVDALCVLLDELGGIANLSAPSRRAFFADLARAARNSEILERAERKEGPTAIAKSLGVHRRTVDRALRGVRVTRAIRRVTRPAWKRNPRASRTP
jgi:hypothetical protein